MIPSSIHIDSLSFGWHEETPLFRAVSVRLDAGRMAVIRGENGSGKSTLVRLAAGMIPHFMQGAFLGGDIRLSGLSVFQHPPKVLFPHIAYVPDRNPGFFLMGESLQEEAALIQAMASVPAHEAAVRRQQLFLELPNVESLWHVPYRNMDFHLRCTALAAAFFLQGARYYLMDEWTKSIPEPDRGHWDTFFEARRADGCCILAVSHQDWPEGDAVWTLEGGSLWTA